ncbi:MAG: type II toxin-antitoxin system HicA family toxin [Bacteroidetes bacterium]|nr:type II toxin-antitoxin system HicA family toxin [Bacteroidota bacterium]
MKSVSGKQLCKIVEKKGWLLKRINGSHHIYKKTGVEHLLVIPVHKNQDLNPGLLRSIMKLAGISENEL